MRRQRRDMEAVVADLWDEMEVRSLAKLQDTAVEQWRERWGKLGESEYWDLIEICAAIALTHESRAVAA